VSGLNSPQVLKQTMANELKKRFPEMDIDYHCQDDDVVACIAPIDQAWEPVFVCVEGEEITVYFGDFTHAHYGCFEDELSDGCKARLIAEDVVRVLEMVFDDQVEFYSFWGYLGGGGFRRRGKQSFLSKFFFGSGGVLWSGDRSH
jgi:hypothetical protein